MKTNEIQLTFYSLSSLLYKELWLSYFSELEKLLHEKLSHLDTNDPIRKQVSDLGSAAEYVCSL